MPVISGRYVAKMWVHIKGNKLNIEKKQETYIEQTLKKEEKICLIVIHRPLTLSSERAAAPACFQVARE